MTIAITLPPRGSIVRVGPAYSMETRARTMNDEVTGVVGTIVGWRWLGSRPENERDVLVVRGVYTGDNVPDATEYDFAVNIERCEVLNTGTV